MNKRIALLLLIFASYGTLAQNLVPNPSFEDFGSPPCSWVVSHETFNDAFNDWIMPTHGSTDMFTTMVDSSCYASCYSYHYKAPGIQQPRTGDVVSCLWTYGTGCAENYREYLEVELLQPLIVGYTYYAEFFVSHADRMRFTSNNLGMLFSDTMIFQPSLCSYLDIEPQINEEQVITDSLAWVRISGRYVAKTAAKYIIIGNFYSNEDTKVIQTHSNQGDDARYYIDDILVMCESCIAFNSSPKKTEVEFGNQCRRKNGTNLSAIHLLAILPTRRITGIDYELH